MGGHKYMKFGATFLVIVVILSGLLADGGSVEATSSSPTSSSRLTVVNVKLSVRVDHRNLVFFTQTPPHHSCVTGNSGTGSNISNTKPLHTMLEAVIQTSGTCAGNVHDPVTWTVTLGTTVPHAATMKIIAVTIKKHWSVHCHSDSKRLFVRTLQYKGRRHSGERTTYNFTLSITLAV